MKVIILVRHATPNVDYSWCSYKKARELIKEYDTTDNIAIEEVHRYLGSGYYNRLIGLRIDKIICSPLPRAQITCQTLFGSKEYVVNDNFKEAENDIGFLPFIRLKLRHWFLINRIKWWLGLSSKKIETKDELFHRICRAFLDIQKVKGNVAVVAHGVFLTYLKRNWFKHNHYKLVDRYKHGCFTVEVFKQEEQK